MDLDRKLRELARDDRVPLPEGYDEMLSRLYVSLAAGREAGPGRKETRPMKTRRSKLVRLLAAAAVLALMAASMTVGALAFGKETVVEVPVEREAIVMEDIGLTLVLPDEWRDRYVVVEGVFEPDQTKTWQVCVRSVYDAQVAADEFGTVYTGMLFTILQCADYSMTAEEFASSSLGGIGRYLFSTENATYAIWYATDIQYDYTDPAAAEEYNSMAAGMKDIQVALDDLLV